MRAALLSAALVAGTLAIPTSSSVTPRHYHAHVVHRVPTRAQVLWHHHLARIHNAALVRAARRRAAIRRRSAALLAAWTRVAVCEEGGWVGWSGAAYPDSLGITAANWVRFGGESLAPLAQIAVARRLLASVGLAGWVPDQGGCAAW